jgi:hypothetical protein
MTEPREPIIIEVDGAWRRSIALTGNVQRSVELSGVWQVSRLIAGRI